MDRGIPGELLPAPGEYVEENLFPARHVSLDSDGFPLTAQTFEIATRLINNPFTGALALVYTEALALELLCSAVGSFSLLSNTTSEEYTERELRCLHTARSVLTRQFAPAPTMLARRRARVLMSSCSWSPITFPLFT